MKKKKHKLKCDKNHKHFRGFGHFLAEFGLEAESSPEIAAYMQFVEAKRAQRGFKKIDIIGFSLQKHHIVPTSFGGRNEYMNFVYLTHDEHMYAHRLFGLAVKSQAKVFGGNLADRAQRAQPSMRVVVRALLGMSRGTKHIKLLTA